MSAKESILKLLICPSDSTDILSELKIPSLYTNCPEIEDISTESIKEFINRIFPLKWSKLKSLFKLTSPEIRVFFVNSNSSIFAVTSQLFSKILINPVDDICCPSTINDALSNSIIFLLIIPEIDISVYFLF